MLKLKKQQQQQRALVHSELKNHVTIEIDSFYMYLIMVERRDKVGMH